MVFKQIEDNLTTNELNGIISLYRKHSPITYEVQLQDTITTPYGLIELDIEDTILLDTGILISEETITAEPTLKLVSPTFPHSNYHLTLDIIHYTGANIFDDSPSSYEVKDTITLDLPPNTSVQIPVENLQKGYIISLNAQLSITHDKTVITGRPPQLTLTSDKTVLSAYDGDTATLTAYYSQDETPIPDTTVTFYNGANSIGTATTDSNGEATLTYTATGIGDMSLTAKIGTLVSEIYSLEDCIYCHLNEITVTRASSSETTTLIDETLSLTLPSDFTLSYDYKGNINNARLGLFSEETINTNRNYSLTVQIASNDYVGVYRDTSTHGLDSGRLTASNNEYHECKISNNNGTVTWLLGGTNSATASIDWITTKNPYRLGVWTWSTGTVYAKNIKIKPL